MPRIPFQLARGTTAENAALTGLNGEVTVDTTKKTLVVHDGSTEGGTPLAKETHAHVAADVSGLKYQVVKDNGSAETARAAINFSTLFTVTDDEGNDQTNVTFADSGVSGGSYGSTSAVPVIAIDAKGRITSATNTNIVFPAQIPTQGGYAGRFLRTDGSGTSWEIPVLSPAYGSAPAAATANNGQLSLPGTGFGIRRSNGTVLEKFGPMTKMNHPNFGSFAWLNQGSFATVADELGTVLLDVASDEATQNLRAMTMALGSAPWKITAAFYPYVVPGASGAEVGICLRDSGTGQLVTYGVGFSSSVLVPSLRKFTNPSTEDSTYTITHGYAVPAAGLVWLQIEDTGANRVSRVSLNGVNWMQVHSVTNSDFLAARNQCGFFADCRGSEKRCAISLVSFVIE